MGRRKIPIRPLKDERNRSVTFLKRKAGLFKKAYELATLCSVDVAVIIFGRNNKLYEFCSTDSGKMLSQYKNMMPYEKKASSDYHHDASHGEEDEEEDEEDESESIARGGHSRTASVASVERHTPDTDHQPPERPLKRVTRQTSKKSASNTRRGKALNSVSSSIAGRKPSRSKTESSKPPDSPETSSSTPKRNTTQRASGRPTSNSIKAETSSSDMEAPSRASTENSQVTSESRTNPPSNRRDSNVSGARDSKESNQQPQDPSRVRQRIYTDSNGKEIGTPPLFSHPVYRAVAANEPMGRPPTLSISTPSTDRHMQMQVRTKSQFTPVNTEHSSLSANLNLPMRSSTALGISYAQQSNWKQSPSGSPIVARQMENFQDFGAYNTPGPQRHVNDSISMSAANNSARPKLKVQIPVGGSNNSTGRSQATDSRTEESQNQGSPSYSNSTSPVVVLPPPSPSTYLTSGAPGGPGNPFARPPLVMNPGEQTPLSSALPSSALQSAGGAIGSGGPVTGTPFGHMTSAAAAAAAASAAATGGGGGANKQHDVHPVPSDSDFLPSPLQFNTPVSTYNISFANSNNVSVPHYAMARNAYNNNNAANNNYGDGRITEYNNSEMTEQQGSPSNSSGSRDGSKNPSTSRPSPEKRAISEGAYGNNNNNNDNEGGENRRQRNSRPTKKSRLS